MSLKLIDNRQITQASINLALEEYLVTNLSSEDTYLLFYRNAPSIILGKNQNLLEEVNYHLAKEKGIELRRRISGGGAVFHDLGNLNFSFISPFDKKMVANWQEIAKPIISALQALGVPAELNYRNDIVVHNTKISGTAQYMSRSAMISHGTLLFDSKLATLDGVLSPKSTNGIASKSLKSFRSKVLNIKDLCPENMTIFTFQEALQNHIFGGSSKVKIKRISEQSWKQIEILAKDKYESWEWVFGRSPNFEIKKSIKIGNEELFLTMEVLRGGLIKSFNLAFDKENNVLNRISSQFVGEKYSEERIKKIVSNSELGTILKLDERELIDFLY
jgi:lipoate-protein ligase A